MKKQIELLVVEDNPEYEFAAREYFKEVKEVTPTFVNNYQEGMKELMKGSYDKALFDLFLPERADMEKPRDPRLAFRLLYGIRNRLLKELGKNQTNKSSEFESVLNKNGGTIEDIQSLSGSFRYDLVVMNSYTQLAKSVIPSKSTGDIEGLLPLGRFLAKAAKARKIPFQIVTSLFHHDVLVEAVCFANTKEGIYGLVDCSSSHGESNKAHPDFWKRAYNKLNSNEGGRS